METPFPGKFGYGASPTANIGNIERDLPDACHAHRDMILFLVNSGK
jgi:hypothetical protein